MYLSVCEIIYASLFFCIRLPVFVSVCAPFVCICVFVCEFAWLSSDVIILTECQKKYLQLINLQNIDQHLLCRKPCTAFVYVRFGKALALSILFSFQHFEPLCSTSTFFILFYVNLVFKIRLVHEYMLLISSQHASISSMAKKDGWYYLSSISNWLLVFF